MKNLRSLRKKQGLTQLELAKRVGLTQSAVSAIEQRGSCSVQMAYELADALNVSIDMLCDRKTNQKAFTRTHSQWLNDAITKLVELEDEFYEG